MGCFDADCKLYGPEKRPWPFPLPSARIVVTATSPARIVTKASHRRKGTRRMTSGAAIQPFTAGCIFLESDRSLKTSGSDLGQATLLLVKAASAIRVCCPLRPRGRTHDTRRLPERWNAQTHTQDLGQTGYQDSAMQDSFGNSRQPRGQRRLRSRSNPSQIFRGGAGNVLANARRQYERYLALAQAAVLSGDAVEAQNYYQHAEHFFRVMRGQEIDANISEPR
jgi:Domain of unknown function (DUF4167)